MTETLTVAAKALNMSELIGLAEEMSSPYIPLITYELLGGFALAHHLRVYPSGLIRRPLAYRSLLTTAGPQSVCCLWQSVQARKQSAIERLSRMLWRCASGDVQTILSQHQVLHSLALCVVRSTCM